MLFVKFFLMASLIVYESLNFSLSYHLSMETIPLYSSDIILQSTFIKLPKGSELKKDSTSQHSLSHYSSIPHDSGSMRVIASYTSSVILNSHGNSGSSGPQTDFSTLFFADRCLTRRRFYTVTLGVKVKMANPSCAN